MTYLLILTANNGEKVKLNFDNFQDALTMKEAFMLMGQYSDAEILNEGEDK
jgi:hypothetical protein